MMLRRCMCSFVRTYQNQIVIQASAGTGTRLLSTHIRNLQSLGLSSERTRLLGGNAVTLLPNELLCKRGMASKKAKNKKNKASSSSSASGGGKHSSSSKQLDLSVGDGIYDLNKVKSEMTSCTDKFEDDLVKRFSPDLTTGIIDNFHVSLNGKTSLLYEIAEVTSQDNEFIITPMVKGRNIEKQLIDSINHTELNLNPRIKDKTISIVKPVSSTDYKTNLLKLSKASGEKCKTIIRKIRQQALSKIKKLKDFGKDDIKLVENQVELLTELSVQLIDKQIDHKKSELKL